MSNVQVQPRCGSGNARWIGFILILVLVIVLLLDLKGIQENEKD